jgi:hypothetical protein
MSLKERFYDHIKAELEDTNFEQIYNRLEEEWEYDPSHIRRMIVLCIYHLEHNNHFSRLPLLNTYLKMMCDEDMRQFITLEQILYIVQECSRWKESTPRNSVRDNMYM